MVLLQSTAETAVLDGIIHEDKLGFNLIYIQAKRWDPSTTIGKPELQKICWSYDGTAED